MFNLIVKKLKSLGITVALAMSKGDKAILKSSGERIPEGDGLQTKNFSENQALRAIQMNKFTEDQLSTHNRALSKFDNFHGRTRGVQITKGFYNQDGEWVEPEYELSIEDKDTFLFNKQMLGDFEENYFTLLFLTNKMVQINDVHIDTAKHLKNLNISEMEEAVSDLTKWESSLTIERDVVFGIPKLEDYTNEIFVKCSMDADIETNDEFLVEFYCMNYNRRKALDYAKDGFVEFIPENGFEHVTSEFNFRHFINIQGFTIKESTATRNDIQHTFTDVIFKNVKKLDKGFVVKFICKKI